MRMTTDEIKVVSFTIIALMVGAFAKHYRNTHPESPKPTPVPRYQQQRSW